MAFIQCRIITQTRAVALQGFGPAGIERNGGTISDIALSHVTSNIVYTASNLKMGVCVCVGGWVGGWVGVYHNDMIELAHMLLHTF